MKDENVLKASFCTEFLGARAVIRTKQAILSLFCGRYSSKNDFLYRKSFLELADNSSYEFLRMNSQDIRKGI